jgi:PAS domain S-box-containing protein
MMDLTGYELEPLRDDGEFALYRARQPGNPVSVLALVAGRSASRSIARLEHEYALAAVLDPGWAVRPQALERHKAPATLLLEDNGGEPLNRILGRPLELTRFLRLAINSATALGEVHRHGLIHKDIKPANLLVDATCNVRLTGFGIASQLPREPQQPIPLENIAGTFAYMAPEQTGRMNRSIDTRSDLYSLGVTLYEMLTGVLPFTASDPMEWIHCHIARRPKPPSEWVSGIPDPVEAIVLKLLAKNAEDRYQTAVGAAADLRRCLAEWERIGTIEAFPVGARDVPDVLRVPEKLYGREEQVCSLLAAFDRVVARGAPELILVSGYSGVGKSSVVNELHKAIAPPRGLFASGKFDQYKRDIPYTTLAQAFQTLVRQILIKSEAEVDQWRSALREALGTNGQLIVNLVPELELLIERQPPLADLPPQEAKNRFQMVFRRFLSVFARKEHPLALFLDDLQWFDTATLDLLEYLVTHSELRYLLLVGAYRNNEVSPSHPLLRTLEAIRNAGAQVQQIVLAPLGSADVGQLVADALHCELERAWPLGQLVREKTGGNPFFAIQFFTALAEEGLVAFDPVTRAWQWNMDRIRAKSYTDNVVELMAGKLKRFSATAQEAVKQLACLGNVAPIATLALIQDTTEETIHAALREAVHAGLVLHQESTCRFLHDRIQQAAYSLIPDEHRAEVHLRIGRALLARMSADELAEHMLEVANQLNRGAALLIDRDEKAQVAMLDLRAGRKAKASAAYTSAGAYFSAGMALLDESDWGNRYELTFSLWLERAGCEFLSGNFEKAEQLIGELLQRAASKVDQAEVFHLKVVLCYAKSEYAQALESALACLRLFRIDIPAHPTWEQVQAEYKALCQTLEQCRIESLIDLPLMTDPELQVAMRLLSVLGPSAFFTDPHLYSLLACRMVSLSIQHGVCGASAHGCSEFGYILGPVFHRYGESYRFAKLACDLVEKHGFIAYRAKAYHLMGVVAAWTQPIGTAIEFNRAAFRAAPETGDLIFACYSMDQSVVNLLVRNDPLDAVQRESEAALEFAQKAGFRDAADIMLSRQRFIATMQGRTATFSTFSDAQFDEATFEAQLTADRTALMTCWYWILKLKARFLSGDYAEALAAAEKAKPLLSAARIHILLPSAAPIHIQLLDYFYYTALTVAACHGNASVDEQKAWRELLTVHQEQLREWAESNPPTFADKRALVSAEIARLEGRDADAMRLYEQAIQLAREHGFVQNEALAHEVAAWFYMARGVETVGNAYLRNARAGYERWGALGKVKQLDERYPHLQEESAPASSIATIGTPVGQLDVQTVVKASQAVSGEIVLKDLIKTLMVITLGHAGAERGLLVLPRGDQLWIEAEATTGLETVEVRLRQALVTSSELPDSVLQYVIRTQQPVILDDASREKLFSTDKYIIERCARSILCLPLIKQTQLVGVLYIENNLAASVFTPARIAVLKLLASQAAISLENARLYAALQHTEAYLAEAQRLSRTGSFGWRVSRGELFWSDESFRILGYDPATRPTVEMVLNRTHPDDVAHVEQVIDRAANGREKFDFEHRLLMPDGSIRHVHVVAHPMTDELGELQFVGALMDITARKHANAALERSEQRYRQLFRDVPVALWQLDTGRLTAILNGLRAQGVEDLSEYMDVHPEFLRRAVEVSIVEEVNDYAVQICGARDRSELLGSMQWFWREGPDTLRRSIESRYRGEELFQETTKLPTVDGRVIDVLYTSARPRIADNLGITLISLVDLTERVRAQEKLQQVQAEFAHAARISMLGELTASIAHELIQPLTAITTSGDASLRWLDRPAPNVAKARKATGRMVANARRAADIIARIRGMAVPRAPERTLVSLDELILEAVGFLRHEVRSRVVTISQELVPAAPKVLADRVQFQQVLVNLIVNAMQAIAQAGSAERRITIRTTMPDRATLCCAVEDSGPGIAPEHLERLFTSFFTTKETGMGMGLSICRSIVEAHGGRIAADNESAHGGARLYFTLPAANGIG